MSNYSNELGKLSEESGSRTPRSIGYVYNIRGNQYVRERSTRDFTYLLQIGKNRLEFWKLPLVPIIKSLDCINGFKRSFFLKCNKLCVSSHPSYKA